MSKLATHPGFVYVIANDANSLVKIGWALKPERRCFDLQAGSPALLEVVREYPGGRRMEQWLHGHFAAQRKHREWFALGGQLRKIDHAVVEYERRWAYVQPQPWREDYETWGRRLARRRALES